MGTGIGWVLASESRNDVKGVTPFLCLGVLVVREKMRSTPASDSCWLATGRTSSHKNFASIPLHPTWMTISTDLSRRSKSVKCDIFVPSVHWHCWLGNRKPFLSPNQQHQHFSQSEMTSAHILNTSYHLTSTALPHCHVKCSFAKTVTASLVLL